MLVQQIELEEVQMVQVSDDALEAAVEGHMLSWGFTQPVLDAGCY